VFAAALVGAQPAPSNPQAELASRMRAVAEAQQHGDPAAVAQANRYLAAFALAQMAELHQNDSALAAESLYAIAVA
jgi:hypothetical protein